MNLKLLFDLYQTILLRNQPVHSGLRLPKYQVRNMFNIK